MKIKYQKEWAVTIIAFFILIFSIVVMMDTMITVYNNVSDFCEGKEGIHEAASVPHVIGVNCTAWNRGEITAI